MPRREQRKRIDEVLEACDLQRTARRKLIGALSKGYRQRVGLADAILSEPAVAILDEPMIGLDPHQVVQIRKLIDSLRGQMTVILSSHILSEVELSCDRVIILNRGLIVATGAPSALREEFFPGRRYEVDVSGSEASLARAAGGLGLACRWEKCGPTLKGPSDGFQRYLLSFESEEDCSESLLGHLTRYPELRIRHFRASHPTLEDIFLAATRRSWEVETDLPAPVPETQSAAPPPA